MSMLNENDFKRLTMFIQNNYGINLSKKKELIEGRLTPLIVEKNFINFTQYVDYIFANASQTEIITLIDKLTTNHTFFMREPSHFNYFKNIVLPYWEINCKDKDLRIWSAGCSTGEEPYTLSMLIQDYFKDKNFFWNTQLLATDICTSVLETAKKGTYTYENVKNLPISWQINYFKKNVDNTYDICDKIKSEVIFRLFNLMDKAFLFKKKFHTIFCRNVMIYFDENTKNELINKLYDCTENGGYLFIGHSETLNKENSKYNYIMPAVYRKR